MSHQSLSRAIASATAAAILAACNGGNPVPTTQGSQKSWAHRTWRVNSFTGTFTEYALPSGVQPERLTIGPDNKAWFVTGGTAGDIAGRVTNSGTIKLFPLPSSSLFGPADVITTKQGSIYTIVLDPTIDQGQDDLAAIRPSGKTTLSAFNEDNDYRDLAAAPAGLLWSTSCVESCGTFPLGVINPFGLRPPFNLTANIIAFGPDGNAYITAFPQFPYGTSYVLQVSPSGTLLNAFPLAANTAPTGIVAGPDGNLWIAETGSNQIARMTTAGVVTQYPIPTPNSGPLFITAGSDGALWFTESTGNNLGRITTTGTVTEYPVPTPNAGLHGIAAVVNCSDAHGRIWFSELNAGKIGKFEF